MVSFISGFFNSKERTLKDFQLLHNLVEKHPESKLADKIKSIASSNVKLLEKFNGYVKQWDKLGLRQNWLLQDPDAVQTLFSTRLIYSIVGFEKTSAMHAPALVSVAGKICMMVEGKYQFVSDQVKDRFVLSSEGGGSIVQKRDQSKWTYLGVKGLVPVDRWEHPSFESVVQLDQKQMKRLKDHVEEETEKTLDDSTCYIQLVTNPRNLCIDPSGVRDKLKKNYKKNLPLHAYVRLIDAKGNVYSTGFGSTHEEDLKQNKMGYFSTINGMPTILDYEEFKVVPFV